MKDTLPTDQHLKQVLTSLEKSLEKALVATEFNRESCKMKILFELLKEQVKHEDTSHTAGPIR